MDPVLDNENDEETGVHGHSGARHNVGTMISRETIRIPTGVLLEETFPVVVAWALEQSLSLPGAMVVAAIHWPSRSVVGRVVPLPEPGEVLPLVVGRHDRVALCEPTDTLLSLRHALVLLSRDALLRPITRVLDLRSETHTFDAADSVHTSLASDGPLALRLGNTALFAIPGALLIERKPLAFSAVHWPTAEPWVPVVAPEERLRERHSSALVATAVSLPSSADRLRHRGLKGPRLGRLVFESGRRSYGLEVDAQALDAGVLMGRYGRCDLSGDDVPMGELVSRVHALVIRIEERVLIFDTGSTNGLTLDGAKVRSHVLSDQAPTPLGLSSGARVCWYPG